MPDALIRTLTQAHSQNAVLGAKEMMSTRTVHEEVSSEADDAIFDDTPWLESHDTRLCPNGYRFEAKLLVALPNGFRLTSLDPAGLRGRENLNLLSVQFRRDLDHLHLVQMGQVQSQERIDPSGSPKGLEPRQPAVFDSQLLPKPVGLVGARSLQAFDGRLADQEAKRAADPADYALVLDRDDQRQVSEPRKRHRLTEALSIVVAEDLRNPGRLEGREVPEHHFMQPSDIVSSIWSSRHFHTSPHVKNSRFMENPPLATVLHFLL